MAKTTFKTLAILQIVDPPKLAERAGVEVAVISALINGMPVTAAEAASVLAALTAIRKKHYGFDNVEVALKGTGLQWGPTPVR